MYDVDLNQVTVRPIAQALGATPAALLAGGTLDKEFELKALPASDGFEWVQAAPRVKDGPIQSLRVGFKGSALAALEIVDAFGQRSMLRFSVAGAKPQVGGRCLPLHAAQGRRRDPAVTSAPVRADTMKR